MFAYRVGIWRIFNTDGYQTHLKQCYFSHTKLQFEASFYRLGNIKISVQCHTICYESSRTRSRTPLNDSILYTFLLERIGPSKHNYNIEHCSANAKYQNSVKFHLEPIHQKSSERKRSLQITLPTFNTIV